MTLARPTRSLPPSTPTRRSTPSGAGRGGDAGGPARFPRLVEEERAEGPALRRILEAVLFATDRPVTVEQLQIALPGADRRRPGARTAGDGRRLRRDGGRFPPAPVRRRVADPHRPGDARVRDPFSRGEEAHAPLARGHGDPRHHRLSAADHARRGGGDPRRRLRAGLPHAARAEPRHGEGAQSGPGPPASLRHHRGVPALLRPQLAGRPAESAGARSAAGRGSPG